MMMLRYLFILLLSTSAYAENVGVQGTVYPIAEQDLLQFIQERLTALQKSGELAQHQKDFQARALASADRPTPVAISRATNARTFHFDPSITLSKPIMDTQGQTLVPQGTYFNPLSRVNLSSTLIFYNGDDPEQVTWAQKTNKSLENKTLLILVKGSITEQSNLFKKAIYFDQQGKLTQRFGIKRVPARVTQDELRLRIDEVKL